MPYIIKTYKGRKYLGDWKNNSGKILKFKTRKEAQTTANIESTQMEANGLDLRVVRA